MATDEEQVEKLKTWWKENGRSVIAGVVIGVGGLFGYRFWIDYQNQIAEQASSHFGKMTEALEAGKFDVANEQANAILTDYGSTDYAVMARFALARAHVEKGEFEDAQAQLQQIVGSAGNSALGYVARKRLASVQMQLAKPDQALGTLTVDFPDEFSAAVEELKGDIYASQGNTGEAVKAYRKALLGNPGPANSQFLQQKLDDLGVTG